MRSNSDVQLVSGKQFVLNSSCMVGYSLNCLEGAQCKDFSKQRVNVGSIIELYQSSLLMMAEIAELSFFQRLSFAVVQPFNLSWF